MSGNITSGTISKIAREYNNLKLNEIVSGIRLASNLNRSINISMQEQVRNQDKQKEIETRVVTGAEIRQAYEDGEYR